MAIFRVSLPGLAPLQYSRSQINSFSSEFNCNAVVSDVGSDDFIEAISDLIMERASPEHVIWLERNYEESEFMQYVEIIE